MTHASLAAHYRPQTFAEVTGQQMITTVLSRACAEEKVAPAYLLSGTRGVGKTTIARIFAKALNCVQAPTGEPCNNCDQCHKITQGNHVDVTEIDGASNNSVDDARALREHIGYAAMEGRYKVFIIDEAHMLSRNAFNALLKTLEEPPARVVFIFATTEVHKFPITIISRCQHFIFKPLVEDELIDHLNRVLEKENVQYDQGAVRLIARRAAGSVRDGMSLLGQSLALGEKDLKLEDTRMVLGLAGQEFFEALMQAILQNDCPRIVELSKYLGEQGVDIGFFLRELTSLWRTLFLIREAGANILPSLSLSFDEAKLWCDMAPLFSTAHLHAAWHMTLDAQRKIIHSPEPAAALELLLLNLALMPRLLPLHRIDNVVEGQASVHHVPSQNQSATPVAKPSLPAEHMAKNDNQFKPKSLEAKAPELKTFEAREHEKQIELTQEPDSEPEPEPTPEQHSEIVKIDESNPINLEQPTLINTPEDTHETKRVTQLEPKADLAQDCANSSVVQADSSKEDPPSGAEHVSVATAALAWAGFCDFIQEQSQIADKEIVPSYILHQAKGIFSENVLEISTASNACYDKLHKMHQELEDLCVRYCGFSMSIDIKKPVLNLKSKTELKQEFKERADLQDCLNILDATILHVSPAHK